MGIDMKSTYGVTDFISGFFLAAIVLTGCGIQNEGSIGSGSGGFSQDSTLTDLALSAGTLVPPFDPNTAAYTATVPFLTPTTTVTATPADPTATVTVNGGFQTTPVNLAEGDNTINVQVTTVGGSFKVYTVTVTRQSVASFAEKAYVKALNTDAGDEFGKSVALSGDTLAVGAPFESSMATGINGDQTDNSAPKSGAVYVFVRSGGIWSKQAYIKASNTDANDQFGTSVALNGDTLVVGAPFESSNSTVINFGQSDDSASYAGAVYVFVRSGGTWTQQAYVKGSNTAPSDQFGSSVALDGDTLVAGAPSSGKVYMFIRSNTTWTQQGYMNAVGIGFGWSVAVSGDTLAVGAPFESSNATVINGDQNDTSAPDAGAAYVFVRSGGTWSQEAYVKAFNTDIGDNFGWSVALSGDTLAVGAPLEDSNAQGIDGDQYDNSAKDAGAVYVFSRDNSAWSQQAYLKASNSDPGDNFGWSVAVSGDVLAVGAPLEDSNSTLINIGQSDNSAQYAGAAYVFVRSGGIWTQQEYVKASNADPYDWFGYSVALDRGTVAVGAVQEDSDATGVNGDQTDNSALDSGAAYVFQ